LERIRTEREALVKTGKIKRGKAEIAAPVSVDNSYYKGLPESWSVCCLRDIGEIIDGGTPSTSEPAYWDGDIPWITPADLSGYSDKFISTGSRKITTRGLAESSAKLMPTGSVLFSSRAPIGYSVISACEVCTNQGFKSTVPFVADMNEWVYHYLRAQVEEIRSRASGTTFKEISGSEMGNTLITVPPLAEQKRIIIAVESAFKQLDGIVEMLA
jgi:type I restriction enzyme S subunit